MAMQNGATTKPMIALGKSPADCWRWLGALDGAGYPRKQHCGRAMLAKRWMWEQMFGPIPNDLVVSSTCGTRECTNPHHLCVQSQADANRCGAGTILLPADVLEIKREKASRTAGLAETLAHRYGCSRRLIFDIWGGRAWSRRQAPRTDHNRASRSSAPMSAAP